ncbi:perilipin-3-like [Carettochelys insculpta]|uniref:perilipin-3-like n=1 Tax=Carettochelys insculpta TaxID=44489 RepID=UPI003EC08E96
MLLRNVWLCISNSTMDSNGKDTKMASLEHGEEEQQTVLKRVTSLPLVNAACDSHSDSNRASCKMAMFRKAGNALLDPSLQAVPDTQESVSSRLTDVKEAMSRVVDMTKEAVQDGMKATKSAVTDSMSTVAESRMGQLAMSGMEAVLGKSEELLDHYLPMTEEELAELAESMEGTPASSAQAPEHRSYFVRLGSLSAKLRQRAYRYSLDKMRHTSQSINEALSQLHQVIGLIEYIKQGVRLQDAREKFQEMWLNWSQKQPKGSEITDLEETGMESETLAMSRSILQQLQDACQVLVSSIQGLPTSLQDKDLSSSLLTQSREMMSRAQEYVDELMAYMMQNAPLSWIVGPFIPSGKGSAGSVEPPSQENEDKEAEVTTASKAD